MEKQKLELKRYGADAEPMKVMCSHCKNEGEILQFHRIDCSVHPEWKEEILDSFFLWDCPVCGNRTEFLYPCQYFDLENNICIVVHQEVTDDTLKRMNQHLIGNGMPGVKHRAVDSFYSLQEMIKIQDEGLDDRVIQLAKPIIIGQQQSIGREVWNGFFSHVEQPEDAELYPNVIYMRDSNIRSSDQKREKIYWYYIYYTDGSYELHGINEKGLKSCRRLLGDEVFLQDDGYFHCYNLNWAIPIHNRAYHHERD